MCSTFLQGAGTQARYPGVNIELYTGGGGVEGGGTGWGSIQGQEQLLASVEHI